MSPQPAREGMRNYTGISVRAEPRQGVQDRGSQRRIDSHAKPKGLHDTHVRNRS